MVSCISLGVWGLFGEYFVARQFYVFIHRVAHLMLIA